MTPDQIRSLVLVDPYGMSAKEARETLLKLQCVVKMEDRKSGLLRRMKGVIETFLESSRTKKCSCADVFMNALLDDIKHPK